MRGVPRARGVIVRAIAALWLVAAALVSAHAFAAYTPPPAPTDPVYDPSHQLSASEKRQLDDKLRAFWKEHGAQVSVFIPASLDGETVEDVSYATARAWKLGDGKLDNGVLLTWAPQEKKIRIETGKGAGGDLTDIESWHIIRDIITPPFREKHWYAGLDAGTDAIVAALGRAPGTSAQKHGASGVPRNQPATAKDRASAVFMLIVVFAIVLIVITAFVRRLLGGGRGGGGWGDGGGGGGFFIGGGGFGGGGGGSDWGGGGGGGGDSGGYGGGGGDFGGGGASGDY